ncbi:MATE family efflux transporter [Vibrio mexicanus]|uniref:MATE family efflux transporter n=1 Tax=Vibrio mexicanus TaxID=1004326 RepID=UPI00063CA63B|nr:MATE family efflux transporter [Vibrio mexicanus]
MCESISRSRFYRSIWPNFIEQLVFSLILISDSFFIALVSPEASIGVNATLPYAFIAAVFLSSCYQAISVYLGQQIGKNRLDCVSEVQSLLVVLAIVLGIFWALILYFLAPAFATLNGFDKQITTFFVLYLSLTSVSIPIKSLQMAYSCLLRVHEQAQINAKGNFIALGVNISINYLLLVSFADSLNVGFMSVIYSTWVARFCQLVYIVIAGRRYVQLTLSIGSRAIKGVKNALKSALFLSFESLSFYASSAVLVGITSHFAQSELVLRVLLNNIILLSSAWAVSVGRAAQVITAKAIHSETPNLFFIKRFSSRTALYGVGIVLFVFWLLEGQYVSYFNLNKTQLSLYLSILSPTGSYVY